MNTMTVQEELLIQLLHSLRAFDAAGAELEITAHVRVKTGADVKTVTFELGNDHLSMSHT